MHRLLSIVAAGVALAASAPVAQSAGERPKPWDGGNAATTASEARFAEIASSLAGRTATVHCYDDAGWAELGVSAYGFVYGGPDGTPEPVMHLSPVTCTFLDAYWAAEKKPTYWCVGTEPYVTWVEKRVRVKVWKNVVVKSRTVKKRVYEWRVVEKPVTTTRTYTFKCPDADTWWLYALSMKVIAHESGHVAGVTSESEAECFGLQHVRTVAVALGAPASEASYIATYAVQLHADLVRLKPEYGTADCKQDGPLDLSPGDGIWP